MSQGQACLWKSHRPRWFVQEGRRNVNVSAFNGYRPQWSDYSEVWCPVCPKVWRTKAKYVDDLPNGDINAVNPERRHLSNVL